MLGLLGDEAEILPTLSDQTLVELLDSSGEFGALLLDPLAQPSIQLTDGAVEVALLLCETLAGLLLQTTHIPGMLLLLTNEPLMQIARGCLQLLAQVTDGTLEGLSASIRRCLLLMNLPLSLAQLRIERTGARLLVLDLPRGVHETPILSLAQPDLFLTAHGSLLCRLGTSGWFQGWPPVDWGRAR
jgi:hypothetical protein